MRERTSSDRRSNGPSDRALSSYPLLVDDKADMTVRQAGRKGGKHTATKHGPEFYREIGRRGVEHPCVTARFVTRKRSRDETQVEVLEPRGKRPQER